MAYCRRSVNPHSPLSSTAVFGEGLPDRFFKQLSDLSKADLLITMGTSLQVQPFASLIDRVSPRCPRLLINLERVGDIGGEDYLDGDGGYSPDSVDGYNASSGSREMFSMFRESGFDFFGRGVRDKARIRDVFFKGKTDEGVRSLARTCGWEEELQRLYDDEARKFAAAKRTGDVADAKEEAQKVAKDVARSDGSAGETSASADDLAKDIEKLAVGTARDDDGKAAEEGPKSSSSSNGKI